LTERLKLFQKVCSAVQFAHQNLVVHRDLKPGKYSGWLRYATREQVRGEPITTESDINSLGVLLYELLTGAHPFQSALTGHAEIVRAILTQDPEKPSVVLKRRADVEPSGKREQQSAARLAHQLTGDVDTIVLTALQKQPRGRYPSAESFAWDLALPTRIELAEEVERFHEQHYDSLYRYLVLSGSTQEEACDLLQEGFLRLWEHAINRNRIERPRSWLIRVLHNIRIDAKRRSWREVSGDGEGSPEMLGASASPTLEAELLRWERHERLKAAMRQLTPLQYQYLLPPSRPQNKPYRYCLIHILR
jgi:RNA polymerase sigma factor (sigma-70 family)